MKRSDFLQRLIGIAGFGNFKLSALISKRKIYLLQGFVAGFRFHKGMELLDVMQENDLIELRREPDNEHDSCAVALYWQQEKIGYIPATDNEFLSRLMDANALPLLAVITHLKREVKPWENVAVAVYFMQEETESLPQHASYLQQLEPPVYTSKQRYQPKRDLMEDLFEDTNRVVHLPSMPDSEAKRFYEKHYSHKKVLVEGTELTLVDTNDIYSYMYNINPLKRITADNGESYIQFELKEGVVGGF